MTRVKVIDSHTEGEPTRLVIEGGPELKGVSLAKMAADFAANHSAFRTGILLEPRGSDVLVGALLVAAPDADAGVIFFNNVGVLGMCGHGTIGLAASLAHLGKLGIGRHRIATPVGLVSAQLLGSGAVSIENVASRRFRSDVGVVVPEYGLVIGDVAYGGNWFFLVKTSPVPVSQTRIRELTVYATALKAALARDGITGEDDAEIDHIEVFGPPERPDADSKNFVLCPGDAYDRSPCGTGTSAKLACLAADGLLAPGQVWRQESIIGTLFEASYQPANDGVLPTITGRAFVTAETTLIFEDADPFCAGILG